ncbi:GIY-YIG nuclease family protein [Blastococcus sp. CT_GayMR16]|uniref:GIY-YIG nuclease family protein n=1 Tax=Blastococcus sp. CT_GayMR16 TaxID=2559607 RepID=UPI00107441A7|nr:GIY-YIG nuclease family protein [Blastococcus sp. CT_GayMR16]TFV90405.1 hypothetical protein E4P38_02905 [Blastococcus sp. CT_GayMR16]
MSDPVWRTAEQLAVLFDVQLRTIWAWRRRGHITPVDGRYDLAEVVRWYDEQRNTRMAALRQGVAPSTTGRVYQSAGRPHTRKLSAGSPIITAVDFGATFVANGTAASFTLPAEAPQREPQPWDGIVESDLPGPIKARVAARCSYLQRIGVPITSELLDRVADVEHRDAARRTLQPVNEPVTVFYIRVGQLIKIGQTVDIASRLRAYPPNAVLLATEIGEHRELEAERHRQFRLDHAHRREWFHPSAALIAHINSLREQPLTPAELAA